MVKNKTKTPFEHFTRYLLLTIGAIIVALSLEVFFVPNQIIDGGVLGIAIMTSYVTGWSLGAMIILLNIPFLYLGYIRLGRSFSIGTIYALAVLAVSVIFLRPANTPAIYDPFLASIFGGISLGFGVGLVLRNNGSLDGTEIVGILIDRKSAFTVGEVVMFLNIFILGSSAFIYSPEKAMYSLVTYLVAYKCIDATIQGLDTHKVVMIVSNHAHDIAAAVMRQLGRGVTKLHGEGAYSGAPMTVLYTVVTRLEVSGIKEIVAEIDSAAFLTIGDIHETVGGRVKRRRGGH